MADFDASILIKNLTKQISDYSNIQAERSKIKGEMFINAIKAKQNFFFKQQEQAMKPAYQAQQALADRYKTQQPAQTTDSFGVTQPRVTATQTGFKEEVPKLSKEYIYRRIQEKKNRGLGLSGAERKFESKYLGVSETYLNDPEHFEKAKQRGTTYFSSLYSGDPKRKENTLKIISNINSFDDLEELKNEREDYEAAGIDVNAILNYYENK